MTLQREEKYYKAINFYLPKDSIKLLEKALCNAFICVKCHLEKRYSQYCAFLALLRHFAFLRFFCVITPVIIFFSSYINEKRLSYCHALI